jgi:N6-adenosine-specific RNA methylase IME4
MPKMKFRTILADPPWPQTMSGKWKRRPNLSRELPYPTMSVTEICEMKINDLAEEGCHLWLWTTNEFLHDGFHVMESWGFKYLAPIQWIKPNGVGFWFVHHTQTLLFGYKDKCHFNKERFIPNVIEAPPGKHSEKPLESYQLIESVSDEMRLELFARPWTPMFPKRHGWHVWGNEVLCDVDITASNNTCTKTSLSAGANAGKLLQSTGANDVSENNPAGL